MASEFFFFFTGKQRRLPTRDVLLVNIERNAFLPSLFLFFLPCRRRLHITPSKFAPLVSTNCDSMMEFDNIPLDTDCKVESAILSSSLLDEITCAICLDIFEEPKRTSCLHVACRRCLEEYHHSCKNEMDIATCRSPVVISPIETSTVNAFQVHSAEHRPSICRMAMPVHFHPPSIKNNW